MGRPRWLRQVELLLTPAQAADAEEVRRRALQRSGHKGEAWVVTLQRSVDARHPQPRIRLLLEVSDQEPTPPSPLMVGIPSRLGGPVLIVGAGPAGYFAAVELLLLGIKPVILERGWDVRRRRYDLRAIMQQGVVDPDSNYCFGEGGAGTYSDGKLYTRSDKRGDVTRVLRLLVEHGAPPDILVDSHPHIGSNRLPQVVERIRQSLLDHGGEIHFGHRVSDFLVRQDRVVGVVTTTAADPRGSPGGAAGQTREWQGQAVILATGHSARDIYELLHRRGATLEAKTFAMGVRVEHPQPLIDEIQYRQSPRDPHLPPSSYRLVTQTDRGGVWSFCMCPGGLIVPAATAPGEIVVNGMSMSSRNSRWANSGIVTEILPADLAPYADGVLAGLRLQQELERRAFAANGDGSQRAPAQRLKDFLAARLSSDLPRSSYVPGLVPAPLAEILGPRLTGALVVGFESFGSKMKGYLSSEAVVVGVESRTSAPVRIPRSPETLQHPQWVGLFPCGEGAGYAGGIISAALDGQRVARAAAPLRVDCI